MRAIGKLSMTTSHGRRLAGVSGLLDCLVAAVQRHVADKQTQNQGWWAIGNMCTAGCTPECIGNTDLLQCLVTVLQHHVNDENVLWSGFYAMTKMAMDADGATRVAAVDGGDGFSFNSLDFSVGISMLLFFSSFIYTRFVFGIAARKESAEFIPPLLLTTTGVVLRFTFWGCTRV